MRPRSLKIFGRIIPDEHADSAYDDFATPVNAGDRLDAIDEKIFAALETFRLELPSWGFANTGTRFGKFIQPAAATTAEEKSSDAGQVHSCTGICRPSHGYCRRTCWAVFTSTIGAMRTTI